MRSTHKTTDANSLPRFQKRALLIVNCALTTVFCLHPLSGIIHLKWIEKELILFSCHQLVGIHEQEVIMVPGRWILTLRSVNPDGGKEYYCNVYPSTGAVW